MGRAAVYKGDDKLVGVRMSIYSPQSQRRLLVAKTNLPDNVKSPGGVKWVIGIGVIGKFYRGRDTDM